MAENTGVVDFVTMAGADIIAGLTMEQGLDDFRPPEKQKAALVHISGLPAGMVSLAVSGRNIIGYVAFYQVNPDYPCLFELGGIEVASSSRKKGVAVRLLGETFANPVFEDYVVYVFAEPYYWDTARTGLSVWRYRRMVAGLYGSAGFAVKSRVKPDTLLSNIADLFMVRTGRNVPDDRAAFYYGFLNIEGYQQDMLKPSPLPDYSRTMFHPAL